MIHAHSDQILHDALDGVTLCKSADIALEQRICVVDGRCLLIDDDVINIAVLGCLRKLLHSRNRRKGRIKACLLAVIVPDGENRAHRKISLAVCEGVDFFSEFEKLDHILIHNDRSCSGIAVDDIKAGDIGE